MRFAMLALALMATPAAAQMQVTLPCAPSLQVQKGLEKYAEVPVGAGLNTKGLPVMIQMNPDTGTWTILIRTPDGTTCIISGGEGYTVIAPEKTVPGTDS